jgi:hypothetical protein
MVAVFSLFLLLVKVIIVEDKGLVDLTGKHITVLLTKTRRVVVFRYRHLHRPLL